MKTDLTAKRRGGRVAPKSNFHHLWDAALNSVFSVAEPGNYYYPFEWPNPQYYLDFNHDGVADPFADYVNSVDETSRLTFYDRANGNTTIWDSGEQENLQHFIGGTRRDINFFTPGYFGAAGWGWMLMTKEVIMGSNTFQLRVIDPQGNEIWSGTSSASLLNGYMSGWVEDLTGDGVDELVVTYYTDALKTPAQFSSYQVLGAPDFTPIYESGQLDNRQVIAQGDFDANDDGINDLTLWDINMTDDSFTLQFRNGADSFNDLCSLNFTGDYDADQSELLGRWAAAGRYAPAPFLSGGQQRLLLSTMYFNGLSNEGRYYLIDVENCLLQLIHTVDYATYVFTDVGDYNADGIMDLAYCIYRSYIQADVPIADDLCRVLEGPTFATVYELGPITDVLLLPSYRTDIDFDDVQDPGFYTYWESSGSNGFLQYLDGTAGYAVKLSIEKDLAHSVRPMLMYR